MPNKPKLCWGGCGRLLVFNTITGIGRRHVVAFDAATGEAHHCARPANAPRVFVEAMQDYSKLVKCDGCGQMVYEVPTRSGVEQFEATEGKWHECPQPSGVLTGIWNLPVISLCNACNGLNLPQPHRVMVIVCVRRILGADPLFLVALKGVRGDKVCAFFIGKGELTIGDLSALCGTGEERKLLTISQDLFAWDGEGQPEHLSLPHNWVEIAN